MKRNVDRRSDTVNFFVFYKQMTSPSTVLNLSYYNKDGSPETTTKMDLTLPGYSWRRKWHEGDKCGLTAHARHWITYVGVIFVLYTS